MKRAALIGALVGAAWMTVLLSLRVTPLIYRLVYFTDFIGFKTVDYLPHGKGIAPASAFWVFNGWLILTSAVQWAVVAAAASRLWRRPQ